MRMSPERFDHLNSLTAPYLTKKCWNRTPISAEHRLAITLRYLATGNSQCSESFNFRVGQSTMSMILREGCSAIWKVLSDHYIQLPQTHDQWKSVANEFLTEWDLPNVIGALDGKHINIQCPQLGGSDYRNYKGFHSTNLMAICDAKYRFIWCDIGSYGRDNDAAVFNRSDICKALSQGTLGLPLPTTVLGRSLPYYLVGDEIFPLKTWLIKPYPGKNLTEPQRVFNFRLSRARRTIENAFGILSSKWRIFRRPINAKTDLIDLIVQACIALHNYLLLTDNAHYLPTGFADSYSDSGEIVPGSWRTDHCADALGRLVPQGGRNVATTAKVVRDRVCNLVNSVEGSISWQLDHVRDCGVVLE